MTPEGFSEQALVEKPTLAFLSQLGYEVIDAYTEQFGADHVASGAPGRDDRSQVVLHHRLRPKLAELNPELPSQAIQQAVDALTEDRSAMDRVRANQSVWRLLRDGAKVTFTADNGSRETETVRFVDWADPAANDFLAVSQFWVVGTLHTRRTDIVCFVNGIPLVLIELKASHKTVEAAYKNNVRDYRDTIPQLFTPNGLVILSNGSETKVGSTFAPWERFGEWKKIADEAELGVVSLETALRGLCEPARLLDAVENFVAYLERPGGLIKVLAQNHQVLGVNAAIRALRDERTREGKLGVFWHTQGSGKSLSMAVHASPVIARRLRALGDRLLPRHCGQEGRAADWPEWSAPAGRGSLRSGTRPGERGGGREVRGRGSRALQTAEALCRTRTGDPFLTHGTGRRRRRRSLPALRCNAAPPRPD